VERGEKKEGRKEGKRRIFFHRLSLFYLLLPAVSFASAPLLSSAFKVSLAPFLSSFFSLSFALAALCNHSSASSEARGFGSQRRKSLKEGGMPIANDAGLLYAVRLITPLPSRPATKRPLLPLAPSCHARHSQNAFFKLNDAQNRRKNMLTLNMMIRGSHIAAILSLAAAAAPPRSVPRRTKSSAAAAASSSAALLQPVSSR
jgi:hypothetical protein